MSLVKGQDMGDYTSGYIRMLLFLGLTAMIAVSGCTIPGISHDSPTVYMPVTPSPTPVPTPSVTPTSMPSITPAPAHFVTPVPAGASPGLTTGAGGDYSRTYTWNYKNVDWSFTSIVQKALYDRFKDRPHSRDVSFAAYAMATDDRDSLRSATSQFRQYGAGYGYTRYDDAMNILAFVQSIPYVDDHPAGAPKYPLETLVDGQGDCKDKAVLAAALLHEAGFDVVLLKFPDHLAVGININAAGASYEYNGARYYHAETTGNGWQIGILPDKLTGVSPTILPLLKNPSLEVGIGAMPVDNVSGIVTYRAQYSIRNEGPGTAKNLRIIVHAMALGQGENIVWRPEQNIELGDLAEGHVIQSDVTLIIPAHTPTRIVCIVSGDDMDNTQASTPDFMAGE